MARLVSNHARPLNVGGVTTLMAVSGEPVQAPKPMNFQLEDGLQWAGAAALLGSNKPAVWGIIGTFGMALWRSR
jgi:hypothetical protein